MTFIILSITLAALTLFLNYCMGKPGGEFSPHEIFSFYTVWLSKRRLKQLNLWYEYSVQYRESLKKIITKSELKTFKNDFNKIIYDAADPFFTWERMLGMCPVCFGFWVSLAGGLCFSKNVVDLLTIISISHISMRIFNKII